MDWLLSPFSCFPPFFPGCGYLVESPVAVKERENVESISPPLSPACPSPYPQTFCEHMHTNVALPGALQPDHWFFRKTLIMEVAPKNGEVFLCQTNSFSAAAILSVLWVTPQLELSVKNAWESRGTSCGWCTAEQRRAKSQGKGTPNYLSLGFVCFILACLEEVLLGHIIFARTCHISFPVAPFLRLLPWLRHHTIWSLYSQILITQISERFMTYLGHPYFRWQVEYIRNNTSCELEAFISIAVHEVDLCLHAATREQSQGMQTMNKTPQSLWWCLQAAAPILTPLPLGSY